MAETMMASPSKMEHSTRKNKKPLMEKRRRARINSCLSQLKSLVLQAIKKDSSQFSKLEKADILELTVKHLRALQRQQAAGVAMTQDPNVVSKYRAGFNECAKEVVRYMASVREVNEDVKERVVGHLANCLQVVNQVSPMETLQHQMKPLHVHIPPQPISTGVTSVAPPPTASVIMHASAAPSQPLISRGMTFTPSSSSAQDCHPSPSSVSTTTTLSSISLHGSTVARGEPHIAGAFKIVPNSSGAPVAVYMGSSNLQRTENAVSVEAVPLYSVSLPPASQENSPSTAFVAPLTSSPSHVMSPMSDSHSSTEASSPVSEFSLLPVDLRQSHKVKAMVDSPPPVPSASYSPLSVGGQCRSPASLAEDKLLWRPW